MTTHTPIHTSNRTPELCRKINEEQRDITGGLGYHFFPIFSISFEQKEQMKNVNVVGIRVA